jgi:hypothetical protein
MTASSSVEIEFGVLDTKDAAAAVKRALNVICLDSRSAAILQLRRCIKYKKAC